MNEKELQEIKKRALYLKAHNRYTTSNHKILKLITALEELQESLAKTKTEYDKFREWAVKYITPGE